MKDSAVLLDESLFETVDNWLQKEWPFKQWAYPGRTITWKEWEQ